MNRTPPHKLRFISKHSNIREKKGCITCCVIFSTSSCLACLRCLTEVDGNRSNAQERVVVRCSAGIWVSAGTRDPLPGRHTWRVWAFGAWRLPKHSPRQQLDQPHNHALTQLPCKWAVQQQQDIKWEAVGTWGETGEQAFVSYRTFTRAIGPQIPSNKRSRQHNVNGTLLKHAAVGRAVTNRQAHSIWRHPPVVTSATRADASCFSIACPFSINVLSSGPFTGSWEVIPNRTLQWHPYWNQWTQRRSPVSERRRADPNQGEARLKGQWTQNCMFTHNCLFMALILFVFE